MKIKKVFGILLTTIVVAFSGLFLSACDNSNSKTDSQKQVPVYQGMVVTSEGGLVLAENQSASISAYSSNRNDDKKWGWHDWDFRPGDHYGDSSDKDEHIDQDKPFNYSQDVDDYLSSLEVVGPAEDMYYAQKNQAVNIVIKLYNPDSFEILSFTLNGERYASYMFEYGSNMEEIIIKVDDLSSAGVFDYTIDQIKYVDGTEIKDVIINADKTVKIGVWEENMVTAEISNMTANLSRISLSVNVSDSYKLMESSGQTPKAYLYDGKSVVQEKEFSLGMQNITFENLNANSLYQVAIVGYYDDLTGNSTKYHTLCKNAMYTESIVSFSVPEITETSASWQYVWNDNFENKNITSLALYLEDDKVQDLAVDATSVEGLLSGRVYAIEATYKNLQNEDENIYLYFMTLAKTAPTVEITEITATKDSITFDYEVTDVDGIANITAIKLYSAIKQYIIDYTIDTISESSAEVRNGISYILQNHLLTLEDINQKSINNLLSNKTYAIVIEYSYDLNDGTGIKTGSICDGVTTDAKTAPTIEITEISATMDSFAFDYEVTDVDGIANITAIKLGSNLVQTAESLSQRVFENLSSFTEYQIVVEYSYDLNEGDGQENASATKDVKTMFEFDAIDVSCLNATSISEGDTIVLNIAVNNPSNANYDSVVINGVSYVPSSTSNQNNIRVSILYENQFEGGNTLFEVEKIVVSIEGVSKEVVMTSNNSSTVFINGKLSILGFDLVDEEGNIVEEHSAVFPSDNLFYYITLSNKTGYTIDSIVISSTTYSGDQLIKVDDNHYKIAFEKTARGKINESISSVAYHNNSISNTVISTISKTYWKLSDDAVVEIDSLEDLLAIDNSLYRYYRLTQDIDMSGYDGELNLEFDGIFDGCGYSIKNLTVIKTYENSHVKIGLFGEIEGIIKDLNIENCLYIITLNSTDSKPYNCSVSTIANTNSQHGLINVKVSGSVEIINNTNGKNSISYITSSDASYNELTNMSFDSNSIADYAFAFDYGLYYIDLSPSINSIGNNSFTCCYNLTSITLPKNLVSLGEYAFAHCNDLNNVICQEGLEHISRYAFFGCTSLTDVVLPEGLISIGDYAFASCNSLKNIILPEGLKSIGDNAFNICGSLSSIILPESLNSIGSYAFDGCENLTNAIIQSEDIYCSNYIESSYIANYAKIIKVLKSIVDNEANSNPYLEDPNNFIITEEGDYYVFTRVE